MVAVVFCQQSLMALDREICGVLRSRSEQTFAIGLEIKSSGMPSVYVEGVFLGRVSTVGG